jgi:hypothetical protein
MSQAVVRVSPLNPPKELAQFFDDPPLIGKERREDYDRCSSAIIAATKPSDGIAWLYALDVINLTWEIMRERKIKANIIKSSETNVVAHSLKAINAVDSFRLNEDIENSNKARQWATDPKSRQRYDKELAEGGFTDSEIIAQAYIRGAGSIDAIDRRIASYELRRMAALRALELHDENMARRLAPKGHAVVDGEFTDVSQEPS